MQAGPLQPSGRVIAGGRLLLACLFLIAIWADGSQSGQFARTTYALLIFYVAWSLGITLVVWKSWWNDARLAAPAHVIDVAAFMVMLYSTEGYTSPYFIFFIFILLSAAIRWGWKETAITAAAIITAYLTAGLLLGDSPHFESGRFILRTGHLFIISAILIWFGANQWVASPRFRGIGDSGGQAGGDAFVAALRAGMAAVGAERGTMLWREEAGPGVEVASVTQGAATRSTGDYPELPALPGCLLFDTRKDRVLMRADASRWRFLRSAEVLPSSFAKNIDGHEGLAVPIAAGTIEGLAVFQSIRALSTDHLDSAPELARDLAGRIQEAALSAAVDERSMAKARVAVARDLHDSVVQFLAGLGFQLEALNRSAGAEGAIGRTLAELKEAVMTEQRHLRAFIRGLKTGGTISFRTLARDCASLCELLARQWSIDCSFNSRAGPGSVPMRTQLDIHHLIREAVANSARHGSAAQVTVALFGEQDDLCLTIADDGRGFAAPSADGEDIAPPASLSGRVREARGQLEVVSAAGKTSVVIRLPLKDAS